MSRCYCGGLTVADIGAKYRFILFDLKDLTYVIESSLAQCYNNTKQEARKPLEIPRNIRIAAKR